ncbi:MAG: hypothetical protein ACXVCV_13705 [Polyangia bacterium]
MRTILLVVALATVAAGCAGVSRGGGASGAAVVSGETKPAAAETGANTNSVATNGSDTSVAPR